MANPKFEIRNSKLRDSREAGGAGFTLLEVLVALAILGIAVTVVIQLFSANLRAVSASGDYVSAAVKAEARMKEILDDKELGEKSLSEVTQEGYRIDISVSGAHKERTENLQVELLDVSLTVRWLQGEKEKALNLRTMKVVTKKV